MLLKDFSPGLAVWQIIFIAVLALALYFVVKLYQKLMKYLDGKAQRKI